jgi:hypothetical protein
MNNYRLEAKVDKNNEYYFEAMDGSVFKDASLAIEKNTCIMFSRYYYKIRQAVDEALIEYITKKEETCQQDVK